MATPDGPAAGQAATRRSPRLSKPGTGAVDPRTVPCSLLGDKTIRARGTMGPGSGEELVSSSKWLKAHEKEQQLPPREWAAGALTCTAACVG